ncbi:hypothetical protein ACHAXT_006440 [Thalassiosira profunda]
MKEKVYYLWGVRAHAATYPVFPWSQSGDAIKDLFQDRRGNDVVYASDFRGCQPDLLAYSSLRGMLNHLQQLYFGYTQCPTSVGEQQAGPLVMDDDWSLCRSDILRTNLDVALPPDGLEPIPVGRNRRLYCDCPPEANQSMGTYDDFNSRFPLKGPTAPNRRKKRAKALGKVKMELRSSKQTRSES